MPLKYACIFVLKKSRLLKVKQIWLLYVFIGLLQNSLLQNVLLVMAQASQSICLKNLVRKLS